MREKLKDITHYFDLWHIKKRKHYDYDIESLHNHVILEKSKFIHISLYMWLGSYMLSHGYWD